ncbi:MAG: hypothetical protein HY727_09600 [Candidatus Rokubacteria bacterium]|nr:hypothetical protein [Candidatus Rokubacteria bacterium]
MTPRSDPTPGWLRRALVLGACAGILAGQAVEAQRSTAPDEVHHIHGLAVDRRDPDVVYVATHTGLVRLRPEKPPEWIGSHNHDLMGFTAHPTDPRLVYASGHPDLPTYRQQGVGNLGLLVSRDGGATWQSAALAGEADFHALTWSPRDGGTLYGWSVAGQTGLHRVSTGSWASARLPARGLANVLALAASPDPGGPLLAGTKAGLLVSRDGGVTWVRVGSLPPDALLTSAAFHAKDARLVYAYVANPPGRLMRSRDGGGTWEPAGYSAGAEAAVIALAVGPDERVVLATTDADVLRSKDGGRTWQRLLAHGRPAGR